MIDSSDRRKDSLYTRKDEDTTYWERATAWPISQSTKRGSIFLGGVKLDAGDAGHTAMVMTEKAESKGANLLPWVGLMLVNRLSVTVCANSNLRSMIPAFCRRRDFYKRSVICRSDEDERKVGPRQPYDVRGFALLYWGGRNSIPDRHMDPVTAGGARSCWGQ